MLMKGISRIVNTNFWLDESVVNDFSPEDKYFMLYLLTNPHTTQLGIYKFVPKTAGFEMGYSQEAVSCLIDRFENKYGIVKYSRKTGEIAIKNYLKYSVVKGGKPVMDCLLKEEEVVEDKSLLKYIYENMKNIDKLNITVKDYINHIPSILNENDNDNDNERYVGESLTNRQQCYENLSKIANKYKKIKATVIKESVKLPDRGNEQCQWCGNMVANVEKHHFPIPNRLNGKDVVYICHDCHKKFHDIETNNSRARNRFVAPSVEEVADYCESNNLEYVNPSAFVDFYGSKNWMVGKNKMTNWHMAVSNWNRRAIERGDRKYLSTGYKKKEIKIFADRPERFQTCPESTWSKLKQYVDIDGNFDWSAYDPSIMNAEDKRWMASVGM